MSYTSSMILPPYYAESSQWSENDQVMVEGRA
jgi:hypothetical protein